MSDLFLKFIYSNSAKGIFRILLAIALYVGTKTMIEDDLFAATIKGGAIALFGAALIDLGVVGVRAVTTTPPLAPDSKGDKEGNK